MLAMARVGLGLTAGARKQYRSLMWVTGTEIT